MTFLRIVCGPAAGVFAMALALVAAAPVRGAPRGGGTFVTATYADCTTFNPYLTSDINSWRIDAVLYDTLLVYDDSLSPQPGLAESWTMAPDAKSWSFKLRKGVRFHDGRELTAADVQFTLDLLREPKNRVARRTCVDELQASPQSRDRVRFETAGDHAFTVWFDRPAPWAIEDWATLPILPKHCLEGKDLATDPFNSAMPVGSGPFKLAENIRGERIAFEAFDGHWAGRPRFDRLVFQVVPDDRRRLEMLRQGLLDHAQVPTRLLLSGFDDTLRDGYQVYSMVEPSYAYIGWQCDPEKTQFFADPRIRRAMTQAIDVDGMLRDVLQGQAVRATTVFERAGWAADAEQRPPALDLAKAKEVLNQAGWYDTDGDGFVDRGGQRFSFVLDAPAGSDAVREQVARVVADLAKLGVEARPRFTEWEQFVAERIQPRDFEAIYLAWYVPIEPDPYAFFHSAGIPSTASPRGLNRNGFSNKEADALIEAARSAVEPAKRRETLVKLDRLLAAESPYTLLFQARQYGLVGKRVRIERPGAVPRMDPALKTNVLDVSRLGMLTPEFLCGSSMTPAK
ncbi:MAG: hypothetical protein HY303_18700 [Candidatus Wallbacteria bacterium]|nr:hypothetical protein [Candidatus Wallbacteria bacterium]